jgi:endonuclease YncB( thermonuclease family)
MATGTRIPMGTDRITGTSIKVLAAAAVCGLPLVGCAPAAGADPGSAEFPQPGFLYGRVTKVKDGDSLVMRTADDVPIEVRLAEIDTPEKGEPWSDAARQALAQMVRGRDIAVRRFDVDKYDRVVGRVFVGGRDVNAELVRQGLAAVYCRFAKDRRLYELEAEARAAKRGLWSGDRLPRGACSKGALEPPTAVVPRKCGAKHVCREMTSCEEAKFYLQQCGVTSMDGDGDGIPCERGVCAQ